jgi:hypothetical protein
MFGLPPHSTIEIASRSGSCPIARKRSERRASPSRLDEERGPREEELAVLGVELAEGAEALVRG